MSTIRLLLLLFIACFLLISPAAGRFLFPITDSSGIPTVGMVKGVPNQQVSGVDSRGSSVVVSRYVSEKRRLLRSQADATDANVYQKDYAVATTHPPTRHP
ncbi:hypothetical protein KP509_16G054900 [Ceratopteris richardii]|uniref:Uncharacterized protein n=1 Tax=Ceratopteris richardii TaxID=49495 RepID=A0A8T2SZS6_CERRI|nr:hypothetical protein KP509_16G054900 [Ceratopteris richardii]